MIIDLEVCANCGEFVKSLWEVTGWCSSCSLKGGRTCTQCRVKQDWSDFYKNRSGNPRKICKTCDNAGRSARKTSARAARMSCTSGKMRASELSLAGPRANLTPGGQP